MSYHQVTLQTEFFLEVKLKSRATQGKTEVDIILLTPPSFLICAFSPIPVFSTLLAQCFHDFCSLRRKHLHFYFVGDCSLREAYVVGEKCNTVMENGSGFQSWLCLLHFTKSVPGQRLLNLSNSALMEKFQVLGRKIFPG